MKYPRSIPDDYRRNLWNLETMLDRAQYYPEADGEPDTMHVHITPETADEMSAQLHGTPNNVLIIQTDKGRFQIEVVPSGLTIIGLDALNSQLVTAARSGNIIEVWLQGERS